MKWNLLAIGLFSFIIYRSSKSEIYLQRTNKGVYSTYQKAVNEKPAFSQGNKINPYSSGMNSSVMTTGSHEMSNKSRRWPAEDRIAFLTNDKLKTKRKFVNGNWVIGNSLYGSFYLAKPFLR
jgi:hypothetical protein